MKISVWFLRGGVLEKEVTYEAATQEEVEEQIANDRVAIEDWMETGFDRGSECFNFNGFMLKKKDIAAIELKEDDF